MSVADAAPGDTVEVSGGKPLHVQASWQSHYNVERIEVVMNGEVVARKKVNAANGEFKVDVPVNHDGWIAVRLASGQRDSFNQPIWAHSSPVYLTGTGRAPTSQKDSARYFVDRIDESIAWVRKKGKFYNDGQRKEVVELHKAGQGIYKKLLR